MKKICLITLLAANLLFTYTQKIEFINSGELIEASKTLVKEAKYLEAIAQLEKISVNDTNYSAALLQKAVTYIAMQEWEKAIACSKTGLSNGSHLQPQFYFTLGTSYENNGQYEEALNIYDNALKEYPLDYMYHFNKAVVYAKMEEPLKTIESCKKAIDLNYYHSASHYLMGLSYRDMGKYVPALISLQTFLFLDPSSDRAGSAISVLSDLASGTVESAGNYKDQLSPDDHIYEQLELIIKSKVALNENYKTPVKKLSDPLVNQLYVLIEKLPASKDKDNFWVRNYNGFYQEIYKQDYFEPFLYLIISSVENKKIQKLVVKSISDIKKFQTWAYDKAYEIAGTRNMEFYGEHKEWNMIFYENNRLMGLGTLKGKGDNAINTGYWRYYYRNAVISAEGSFNDEGKKDGEWKYYYDDGGL